MVLIPLVSHFLFRVYCEQPWTVCGPKQGTGSREFAMISTAAKETNHGRNAGREEGKRQNTNSQKAAVRSLEQARHKFSRRRCYYDSLAGVTAAGIRALRYRKGTIFDAVILACSGRIRLGCPSASGSPVAQALVPMWQHTTIDIGYLRYTAVIVNVLR